MIHSGAANGMHTVGMIGNATMHNDVLVCEYFALKILTDRGSSDPHRLTVAPVASAGMQPRAVQKIGNSGCADWTDRSRIAFAGRGPAIISRFWTHVLSAIAWTLSNKTQFSGETICIALGAEEAAIVQKRTTAHTTGRGKE